MAVIFSSLLVDTIVVSAILALLYYLATRNFNYWEKRGVRSVSQWPFLGSLPYVVLQRENLSTALQKKYEQMAGEPFFGMSFLGKPVLFIRDLDLVKSVLVKDAQIFLDRSFSIRQDTDPLFAKNLAALTGKKWRYMRMKLTPTFTSGKMRKMLYLVDECGKQLATYLAKEASSGGVVDVKECTARYGTDVIASCAFGVNANALADPDSKFRSVLRNLAVLDTFAKRAVAGVAFIFPAVTNLFRMKFFDEKACNFVRNLFWDVVAERKKTGEARSDFVELFMKIRDEEGTQIEDTNDLQETNNGNVNIKARHPKKDIDIKLEDDDIVAQAFVFLLAGFEGQSTVLTFCVYELALNPDVQKNLRNEITTVLDKHDGQMSYDAIAEMSYLDMAISETLRKYPPTGFLERKCLSVYKIPGTEVTIEKDTPVMLSVAGIQADPEIYPEPQKFEPERFSAENKLKRSPYAYLPFGEGPRNCIGMRFAIMQVKSALVHILTSHQILKCAQTPRPPLTYEENALALASKDKIVVAFKKLQ